MFFFIRRRPGKAGEAGRPGRPGLDDPRFDDREERVVELVVESQSSNRSSETVFFDDRFDDVFDDREERSYEAIIFVISSFRKFGVLDRSVDANRFGTGDLPVPSQ